MITVRRLMLKKSISNARGNSFLCKLITVCFSSRKPDKLTVFTKFSICNIKAVIDQRHKQQTK